MYFKYSQCKKWFRYSTVSYFCTFSINDAKIVHLLSVYHIVMNFTEVLVHRLKWLSMYARSCRSVRSRIRKSVIPPTNKFMIIYFDKTILLSRLEKVISTKIINLTWSFIIRDIRFFSSEAALWLQMSVRISATFRGKLDFSAPI